MAGVLFALHLKVLADKRPKRIDCFFPEMEASGFGKLFLRGNVARFPIHRFYAIIAFRQYCHLFSPCGVVVKTDYAAVSTTESSYTFIVPTYDERMTRKRVTS